MPEAPWPPGLSFDDATLPLEELDRRCSLTERWPDWRILTQDQFWLTGSDDFLLLDDIEIPDLADLLIHLRSSAPMLHAQAATDEQYATSSALRWAYDELGVLTIPFVHPLAWLGTMPLVRVVERRLNDALGDAR